MENMNDVKTPKEYRIKKIEELKGNIPSYLSTFASKIACASTLPLLTLGIQSPMLVTFVNVTIMAFAIFYIEASRKNNNLKEIDRLQTDLLLDNTSESELKRILEDKYSRLSNKKSRVLKSFYLKAFISLIFAVAGILVKNADDKIRYLNTILLYLSTFEMLSGIEDIFERDYLSDRMDQIEEKQKLNELNRTRKL